jgi:DNA-binding NtrC family response regulator
MTAYGTTETAIEAMKYGAFDYIIKPFPIPQMKELVEKAISLRKLMKEQVTYAQREDEKHWEGKEERIIGASPKMQEIYKLVGQISRRHHGPSQGESGTGKELLPGRFINTVSVQIRPFCPSIAPPSDTLPESGAFGHERGLHGAISAGLGNWSSARRNGFLDEIGTCLSPIKLLRILQEQVSKDWEEWKPSGRRVICRRNQQGPGTAITNGQFRRLYYRLNVVSITVPLSAIENRHPELVSYFLKRFNRIKKEGRWDFARRNETILSMDRERAAARKRLK